MNKDFYTIDLDYDDPMVITIEVANFVVHKNVGEPGNLSRHTLLEDI